MTYEIGTKVVTGPIVEIGPNCNIGFGRKYEFASKMREHCYKTATITGVSDGGKYYKLDIDDGKYYWHIDWLTPVYPDRYAMEMAVIDVNKLIVLGHAYIQDNAVHLRQPNTNEEE